MKPETIASAFSKRMGRKGQTAHRPVYGDGSGRIARHRFSCRINTHPTTLHGFRETTLAANGLRDLERPVVELVRATDAEVFG